MSQTQRYMSRTAGRVERRDVPAPYTPTKPAPKPEKNSTSIWDYIKSWSFFTSRKDTASEEPEPTSEPSSPTDAPPPLQDIITHHRTASPNLRETEEAIVAMQAKATKNLYERGLALQREHELMVQEMAPPSSTSPSEPAEEEKPAPKVYHMPFYRRPGTKEWFIQIINDHSGKSPNERVANYLLAKRKPWTPADEVESSAISEVLMATPNKNAPPPPAPAPAPAEPRRPLTGLEILARIEPKQPEIPVFVDEWITKPKLEYCLTADDIWDGVIYSQRPRDIPPGMEYRTLIGGRGYLQKKRPGGIWNTGRPPQPTASASKRPRLGDGGLSASTSAPMGLSLPPKSTDPELFIPHVSKSKPPPPPPLISTGGMKLLAESQKNEAPKKEAVLKKSQTYKTMQEIVIEETAKKAAEEKERQMKELKERAMAALDGGAGRPPVRRNRHIFRYPDPQDSGKQPSFKKRQLKKEQAKKVPTVNDILDIHTGRADPLHFDTSAAATSDPLSRPSAMKPYEPTPRKRSPKRSLDEHREHGEVETVETSPKRRVKTNSIVLATHVQATSGSGAAAEDAIVIDDLDEEMNDARAPAPAITLPIPIPSPTPTPAPAPTSTSTPAQASSVPSKSRAMPTLPPMNPLIPPYVRAFSPSRPSPLRMVSSVDSPEGSPHPTSLSIFNAKPKPEPEVIDVDAEEDQLAEEDNEKTPTHAPTSTIVAPPVSAPVSKPTPAPAPVTQLKPQRLVGAWSFPMPKVPQPKGTQPMLPVSPKTAARNAPVASLRDYSNELSGTPLCPDVIMGDPEAQTIARIASLDELPTFEIDLSPMFDPTPWIERKNIPPPARDALVSAQAPATVRQTISEAPKPDGPITPAVVTPALAAASAPAAPAPVGPIAFNWAAAGLKPSAPVAGEWTCTVCNCKTKDTLSKCSVCEAPKPGAAAPAPTPAPPSPPMPALIPDGSSQAAPVGFNWAAAGLKLPTKALGTWTCSVCTIDNKPENDKCIACEALKPGSVPVSTSLTSGFNLPPPIRNNGFTWGIPPSALMAPKPAINRN